MGIRCADHVTSLYPQKLALTSPTGGGRSVGIVRSRTRATEFFFFINSSYGRPLWLLAPSGLKKTWLRHYYYALFSSYSVYVRTCHPSRRSYQMPTNKTYGPKPACKATGCRNSIHCGAASRAAINWKRSEALNAIGTFKQMTINIIC